MLRWTLAYGRGGHLTRFPLFRTGHFESIFRSATQRCVVRGCRFCKLCSRVLSRCWEGSFSRRGFVGGKLQIAGKSGTVTICECGNKSGKKGPSKRIQTGRNGCMSSKTHINEMIEIMRSKMLSLGSTHLNPNSVQKCQLT